MLSLLGQSETWIALATLTLLETVLGIDNVIVLSVLVGRLPRGRWHGARLAGLGLAMLTRIALLLSVVWLTHLTQPWLVLLGRAVSGRDLILGGGGLLLAIKSVLEIHRMLESAVARERHARVFASFALVVIQIALVDVVFSLDSVFTAVGLARPDQVPIMVAAIVLSIIAMMWLSGPISEFIDRYPSVKVLVLAFLVLIGLALMAQAVHWEIPKGYLYGALAFSVAVEITNIRLRRLLEGRPSDAHRDGGRGAR
jgi:predicted tellurium resistance membrane protein TerC